jgi:hypothetical protein
MIQLWDCLHLRWGLVSSSFRATIGVFTDAIPLKAGKGEKRRKGILTSEEDILKHSVAVVLKLPIASISVPKE